MNMIKTFEYENQVIEFDLNNDDVMVNATEMAKAFGKRVDHFLKTDHAKAFIEALKLTPYGGSFEPLKQDEILKVTSGSRTWMHRLLALKFAAWLHPQFEVWVYFTIDQLLFGEYRAIQESLKEQATIKDEITKLEEKLQQSDDYQQLEQLKLKERQLAYRRRQFNSNQLQLFRTENQ